MTPQGWQNLAVERHRIIDRADILPSIQAVHEDAFETQEGDYLAYWLGEDENRDLIGIAWQADDVWFYAYMNRIAVELGVHCTLVIEGKKARILPTLRHKVETGEVKVVEREPETTIMRDEIMGTVIKRSGGKRNVVLSREVFREKGQWYALVEMKSRMRQLGPFASKGEAERAEP